MIDLFTFLPFLFEIGLSMVGIKGEKLKEITGFSIWNFYVFKRCKLLQER